MKNRMLMAALCVAISLGSALCQKANATDPLNVIVTIKPIHSLAAAVMEGGAQPKLLIGGAGSPHSYALKPSDAKALGSANVIIRVSENLETFLEKPIDSLAKHAKVVTLDEINGLTLLPVREGGAFEAHEHEADDHGHKSEAHGSKGHDHEHDYKHGHSGKSAEAEHEHEANDAHLWLSPANAMFIADHLAAVFSELQPEQAQLFKDNAEKLKQRIAKLDADLKQSLAPVKGKPFIVFHDAYQYFEKHYGLSAAGSVTLSPERQPGAARLKEIRRKISRTKSVCVFSEPQFKPKFLETLVEGTDAKMAVIDPLGADLAEGPDQYFELMTNLARSLNDCLGGSA